ncbi:MAG: hypothetical protein GY771_11120 [bacterium]|nr:hypothetical protein [bacterium]
MKRLANFVLISTIAFVYNVIDGDTIKVELDGGNVKDIVRLIGINTPEKKQSGYDKAKEYLEERILGRFIWIETDIQERENEHYHNDRLLGYIWFDGKNINIEMVEKGYAKPEEHPPNVKYRDELRKAAGE